MLEDNFGLGLLIVSVLCGVIGVVVMVDKLDYNYIFFFVIFKKVF